MAAELSLPEQQERLRGRSWLRLVREDGDRAAMQQLLRLASNLVDVAFAQDDAEQRELARELAAPLLPGQYTQCWQITAGGECGSIASPHYQSPRVGIPPTPQPEEEPMRKKSRRSTGQSQAVMLAYAKDHGEMSWEDVARELVLQGPRARKIVRSMVADGLLTKIRGGKGTRESEVYAPADARARPIEVVEAPELPRKNGKNGHAPAQPIESNGATWREADAMGRLRIIAEYEGMEVDQFIDKLLETYRTYR
jgi:hypothetical protein